MLLLLSDPYHQFIVTFALTNSKHSPSTTNVPSSFFKSFNWRLLVIILAKICSVNGIERSDKSVTFSAKSKNDCSYSVDVELFSRLNISLWPINFNFRKFVNIFNWATAAFKSIKSRFFNSISRRSGSIFNLLKFSVKNVLSKVKNNDNFSRLFKFSVIDATTGSK